VTKTTISQSDLAQKTQEIVDRIQRGEVTFVERSGRDQVVLLDALDFRLLRALAQCAIPREERGEEGNDPDVKALGAYLVDEISLGKTAELLNLSWFELRDSFFKLGIPLRLGPATLEEARAEVAAARKFGRHPS
jgi:predicted HTH domain antitoxin